MQLRIRSPVYIRIPPSHWRSYICSRFWNTYVYGLPTGTSRKQQWGSELWWKNKNISKIFGSGSVTAEGIFEEKCIVNTVNKYCIYIDLHSKIADAKFEALN
jgi:hypothetical protein